MKEFEEDFPSLADWVEIIMGDRKLEKFYRAGVLKCQMDVREHCKDNIKIKKAIDKVNLEEAKVVNDTHAGGMHRAVCIIKKELGI